jgi:hypothetical protein
MGRLTFIWICDRVIASMILIGQKFGPYGNTPSITIQLTYYILCLLYEH